MNVLVTGSAGFIGYHLVLKLVANNICVTGLDSINDYYDENLKYARLEKQGIKKTDIIENALCDSQLFDNYKFIKANLESLEILRKLFDNNKFDCVINLAAQPGVRFSLINPHTYIKSNIEGFLNILECCRHHSVSHLIYASSSSVYGLNNIYPYSTDQNVDHPASLYAASKKSNELMAHAYSSLFDLPTTGLRFFTVYGPWGRPDMATYIFTKSILEGIPINLFNNGEMERDFTYIDDIVEGIYRTIVKIPDHDKMWNVLHSSPSESSAPYKIYNVGNGKPVRLLDLITNIENELGIKAILIKKPIQPGDVEKTWADTTDFEQKISYKPMTEIKTGIQNFVRWYKEYYKQS